MSSQRESGPSITAQAGLAKLSVGQFVERVRGEVIALSNTFGYFCDSLPMSEELVKEYLEEPVAALPPAISAMLPKIAILLVPYLERAAEEKKATKRRRAGVVTDKPLDFVVSERPAEGLQSWTSQVGSGDETVLVFALKEQDVAEYHYRFYRRLAGLVAEKWSKEAALAYMALIRDELSSRVHGEVDDESWQAKQALIRRQANVKRESAVFSEYVRQSFVDTLTLYLHGICCDIDVETGPRQLPSRYMRKRLNLLKSLYPPPQGYAVYPEDSEAPRSLSEH